MTKEGLGELLDKSVDTVLDVSERVADFFLTERQRFFFR